MNLYKNWFVTSMLTDAEQVSVNSQKKITFKKMIASEDIVSDADFSGLTNDALTTIKAKQTALISSTTVKGSNVTITSVFTNAGITADYMMNTIMLVAEYNGSEFLAAITAANRAYRVPMESDNERVEYTIKAQLGISNTELVNLNMDPAAIATNEQLAATKKEILTITDNQQKHLETLDQKDTQNVKLTGNQTIKDSKTFSSPIVGNLLGNAKNADYVRGINIANNTSFSGLKDSGRFIASGLQTGVTGLPSGIGAKYEVNQFVSGTSGYRTLLDNENNAYYAMMNNGVWSPWHKFVAADLSNEFLEDATFNKDVRAKGKVITSGLELSHSTTPFIDFHYQNSALDWTTRLIEQAPGRLDLIKTDNSTGELHANLVGNATSADKLSSLLYINNIPTDGRGRTYNDAIQRDYLVGNKDFKNYTHPGVYPVQGVINKNNPGGGKELWGYLVVNAKDDSGQRYSTTRAEFHEENGDIWYCSFRDISAPWYQVKNAVDTRNDMLDIKQWDNLIPNSNFEGNGLGWTLGTSNVSTKLVIGYDTSHFGADASQPIYALLNRAPAATTANWGGAESTRFVVWPGGKYYMSAWVYSEKPNNTMPPTGTFGINWYNEAGTLIPTYPRVNLSDAPENLKYLQWHKMEEYAVAPSNAAWGKFIFNSRQGAAEYLVMPMVVNMTNRDVAPSRYVPGMHPFDRMLSFLDMSYGVSQDIGSINRFKNDVDFYGVTSFWSKPYFHEGADFSKGLTVKDGDVHFNGGKLWTGPLEVHNATPYIDFHFGSDTSKDFTTRLIEQVKGKLSLFNGDPFGKGILIADLEGNATSATNAQLAAAASKLAQPFKVDGQATNGSGEIHTNGIQRKQVTGAIGGNVLPGFYSVYNATDVVDSTAKSGFLIVTSPTDSTSTLWTHQLFIDVAHSRIYIRDAGSSGTPSWKLLDQVNNATHASNASLADDATHAKGADYATNAGRSSTSGLADRATKLETARTIDNVPFDGSSDISTWRKVNVGRIYSTGNPLNGGVFDIWRQGNLWYIGPWSTNVDYHITGGPEGSISLDVHYDNANEIPPNTPTALPTFLNSASGISPECERVSATLIRFRFPENREGSDAQLRIGSCMLMG